MLELIRVTPELARCALRGADAPAGRARAPDRRGPLAARTAARPRRITDDLAWLRVALEDPELHGLRPIPRQAVAAWAPDDEASNASAASATARCSRPPASSSTRTGRPARFAPAA